jgi:plasmid stabilization system protein ParE
MTPREHWDAAWRETIERSPEARRLVHNQVRRVLTRRFPFAAFYVVGPDHVSGIAVLHQASDPQRWQSRS